MWPDAHSGFSRGQGRTVLPLTVGPTLRVRLRTAHTAGRRGDIYSHTVRTRLIKINHFRQPPPGREAARCGWVNYGVRSTELRAFDFVLPYPPWVPSLAEAHPFVGPQFASTAVGRHRLGEATRWRAAAHQLLEARRRQVIVGSMHTDRRVVGRVRRLHREGGGQRLRRHAGKAGGQSNRLPAAAD